MKIIERARGTQRQVRVAEELKRVLVQILQRPSHEMGDVSVTITDVVMSPCLRQAKVYVVPLGGGDVNVSVDLLKKNTVYMRKQVARMLPLKFVPELKFFEDDTFDYVDRIENLLKSVPKVSDE